MYWVKTPEIYQRIINRFVVKPIIVSCAVLFVTACADAKMKTQSMYTYLALGDSYTIGEKVATEDNFPNQTVANLRRSGLEIADPDIIATTGWTTDELAAAIKDRNITDTFSIVTLLIGVNNQYRGRDTENFKEEYTDLLEQAIKFAGGNPDRVFVLSIPDWGVTPFAEGKDRDAIAKEIDAYNKVKRSVTSAHKCSYLEITESTRIHGTQPEYLVDDKLHYSAKEYTVWAKHLSSMIVGELKKD